MRHFRLLFLFHLISPSSKKPEMPLRGHLWKYAQRAMNSRQKKADDDTCCFFNGGLGRNRTNDTRIFSPLLYQLSYETTWLREKDLNQRPPGYEPDELTNCSTPRYQIVWYRRPGSNRHEVAPAGF